MARWKAMPAGLDPAVVEFVAELRRLKDASGLSLRDLADGTGYSSSSWERYLGGRLLPPREAVESMATAVAADSARLLARYERARDAWRRDQLADSGPEEQADSGPAEGGDSGLGDGADSGLGDGADSGLGGEDDSGPADTVVADAEVGAKSADPRVRAFLRQLATVGISAAAGAGIAVLVMAPGHSASATAATSRTTVATAKPVPYTCHFVRKAGLWYAGNSATRTDHLQVDMWGPEVAELQCLLQHAGQSPGGIDGNFGPLTETAVIDTQKAFHLDVDGQVGPQTWAALRR
ncbi:peptidoglycan-binding protein [Streptomyces sp. NPDC051172]|uniref:peptidoglycan-binding protein n=1 Tax=Streptomyces sp. NPDC051172 TaxID=3155796 RepID=UPI003429A99D